MEKEKKSSRSRAEVLFLVMRAVGGKFGAPPRPQRLLLRTVIESVRDETVIEKHSRSRRPVKVQQTSVSVSVSVQ